MPHKRVESRSDGPITRSKRAAAPSAGPAPKTARSHTRGPARGTQASARAAAAAAAAPPDAPPKVYAVRCSRSTQLTHIGEGALVDLYGSEIGAARE